MKYEIAIHEAKMIVIIVCLQGSLNIIVDVLFWCYYLSLNVYSLNSERYTAFAVLAIPFLNIFALVYLAL